MACVKDTHEDACINWEIYDPLNKLLVYCSDIMDKGVYIFVGDHGFGIIHNTNLSFLQEMDVKKRIKALMSVELYCMALRMADQEAMEETSLLDDIQERYIDLLLR